MPAPGNGARVVRMAGIKRLQAVPVVFLWIALCLPGAAARGATSGEARDGAFAVVLSGPCAPHAQLVRAKADRPLVFSTGCLAPPASSLALQPSALTLVLDRESDPPSVRFTCPPLSPRPPPAA